MWLLTLLKSIFLRPSLLHPVDLVNPVKETPALQLNTRASRRSRCPRSRRLGHPEFINSVEKPPFPLGSISLYPFLLHPANPACLAIARRATAGQRNSYSLAFWGKQILQPMITSRTIGSTPCGNGSNMELGLGATGNYLPRKCSTHYWFQQERTVGREF